MTVCILLFSANGCYIRYKKRKLSHPPRRSSGWICPTAERVQSVQTVQMLQTMHTVHTVQTVQTAQTNTDRRVYTETSRRHLSKATAFVGHAVTPPLSHPIRHPPLSHAPSLGGNRLSNSYISGVCALSGAMYSTSKYVCILLRTMLFVGYVQ